MDCLWFGAFFVALELGVISALTAAPDNMLGAMPATRDGGPSVGPLRVEYSGKPKG